jgi:threonyl-tRNA synthetase
LDFAFEVYKDFGFTDITLNVSTRPPQRIGSDEVWDKAENALIEALNKKGLPWVLNPGDGAFYGPKIDFKVRDCIGRIWQTSTLQVDFQMPGRLGAYYIAEDGSKQVPVMLHRAIFGSLERFIGILIEHYAGKFPSWLAPIQAVVMNITDYQADYAVEIAKKLQEKGFRCELDLRNEKIGFKIREQTLQRIPYLLVVGDKEVAAQTVAVRTQDGKDLGSLSIDAFCDHLADDVVRRGLIALEE